MRIENVKVVNCSPTLELPKYATPGSDAVDLYACFDAVDGEGKVFPIQEYDPYNNKSIAEARVDDIYSLYPGCRCIIPTGLVCEVPDEFRLHITPRSGMAIKFGITVLNTPGKIDSDYRGMIGIVLINHSLLPYEIKHGQPIAQMAIEPSLHINWITDAELSETERGSGGFGHSDLTDDFSNLPDPPMFEVGEKVGLYEITDVKYDRQKKTYVYMLNGDYVTEQFCVDTKL